MANWTATTTTTATPDQVLEVLTHPDEIRRWSPIDFELDDLDTVRLAPGTRARVTGRLAGVSVGFDVEGHAADTGLLELSARGPPRPPRGAGRGRRPPRPAPPPATSPGPGGRAPRSAHPSRSAAAEASP